MNILDIRTYSNNSVSFVQIDLETNYSVNQRAFELLMDSFGIKRGRCIETAYRSLTTMIHNHKSEHPLEIIQFQMEIVKDGETGKNIINKTESMFLTTTLKEPAMVKCKKVEVFEEISF